MSNYSQNFAELPAEERIRVMDMFTDDALWQMAAAGYFNEFTGETMTASRAEVLAVYELRQERYARWESEQAEQLAEEISPALSDVHTDTVSVGLYTLAVNGQDSEHGQYVTKFGIAAAGFRHLLAAGIDPTNEHVAAMAALLAGLDTQNNSQTIAGLQMVTRFVANS